MVVEAVRYMTPWLEADGGVLTGKNRHQHLRQ